MIAMTSTSMPSTSPSVVRVERILMISARIWLITSRPRRRPAHRLPTRSARGRSPRATRHRSRARAARSTTSAAISPTRSIGAPATISAPSAPGDVSRPSRRSASCSTLACGLRTRTVPPTRLVSSRERRLDHELALGDDQDVVDGLGDLGQDVARHEHRAPALRVAAQEVAEPAHALGIEAVRGLVEDQQVGVAEQRAREPEPLAHAERVALDAAARGAVELDELQHLVDARVGNARGLAERAQVVAARAPGMEVGRLEHGADAVGRPLELGVARVEHERAAAGRHREPEQHAQRRRLAGAVRPEEAGDRARLEREREVADRLDRPELLGERVCEDDGRHADHPTRAPRGIVQERCG